MMLHQSHQTTAAVPAASATYYPYGSTTSAHTTPPATPTMQERRFQSMNHSSGSSRPSMSHPMQQPQQSMSQPMPQQQLFQPTLANYQHQHQLQQQQHQQHQQQQHPQQERFEHNYLPSMSLHASSTSSSHATATMQQQPIMRESNQQMSSSHQPAAASTHQQQPPFTVSPVYNSSSGFNSPRSIFRQTGHSFMHHDALSPEPMSTGAQPYHAIQAQSHGGESHSMFPTHTGTTLAQSIRPNSLDMPIYAPTIASQLHFARPRRSSLSSAIGSDEEHEGSHHHHLSVDMELEGEHDDDLQQQPPRHSLHVSTGLPTTSTATTSAETTPTSTPRHGSIPVALPALIVASTPITGKLASHLRTSSSTSTSLYTPSTSGGSSVPCSPMRGMAFNFSPRIHTTLVPSERMQSKLQMAAAGLQHRRELQLAAAKASASLQTTSSEESDQDMTGSDDEERHMKAAKKRRSSAHKKKKRARSTRDSSATAKRKRPTPTAATASAGESDVAGLPQASPPSIQTVAATLTSVSRISRRRGNPPSFFDDATAAGATSTSGRSRSSSDEPPGGEGDSDLPKDKDCELCHRKHTGTYGGGRFCSAHCARHFSIVQRWEAKQGRSG